jgi:surfactin synthase thioesterase subunit
VQTGAIIVGHILGVVLAHDAALRVERNARPAQQLPLVAAMIGFTVGGLALLFSV